MPVISAATAAQDGELRQDCAQLVVFLAELRRIADVEIRRDIELGMAALGGIGAQAAQSV